MCNKFIANNGKRIEKLCTKNSRSKFSIGLCSVVVVTSGLCENNIFFMYIGHAGCIAQIAMVVQKNNPLGEAACCWGGKIAFLMCNGSSNST